jgi:D-arabinose 1-dehydrogenase-like Zn-dependent alcohol dehydrogenase
MSRRVASPTDAARSMRAVAHGGTVSLIGFLAGAAPALPLVEALVKGVRLQGIATGSRADMEEAAAVLARHGLRPVIDKVVALEELPAALTAMVAGGHFGKIAVSLL